jgi:hypothetical protein
VMSSKLFICKSDSRTLKQTRKLIRALPNFTVLSKAVDKIATLKTEEVVLIRLLLAIYEAYFRIVESPEFTVSELIRELGEKGLPIDGQVLLISACQLVKKNC